MEQEIIIELNKVIYSRKALSFHLDESRDMYVETFTKLEITPEQLELLCQEIEQSNLRKIKPIKFMVEDHHLPMVVMI